MIPDAVERAQKKVNLLDPNELDDLVEELQSPLSDPWHQDAATVIIAMRARCDALQACVDELVACKALKDQLVKIEPPRTSPDRNYAAEELREEYERRKPLAWAAARALTTPQEDK